jgi:hypothetical protein
MATGRYTGVAELEETDEERTARLAASPRCGLSVSPDTLVARSAETPFPASPEDFPPS